LRAAALFAIALVLAEFARVGECIYYFTAYGWGDGPIVFNRLLFQCSLVAPVQWAGPWFLVAMFAYRAWMHPLPDDRSPYPRRYCGRCRYNLLGVTSPRCPECGSELDMAAPAE
jgi:hypothetical protein